MFTQVICKSQYLPQIRQEVRYLFSFIQCLGWFNDSWKVIYIYNAMSQYSSNESYE